MREMREAADKDNNVRKIPVVEETFQMQREVIDAGGVRIKKDVDEENVTIPLLSRTHGYSIEHVSKDQFVDHAPPAMRYEGNVMVISILREEAVVVKRLKLVEEIRITPSETETVTQTELTLKKERITIQKDPPENR